MDLKRPRPTGIVLPFPRPEAVSPARKAVARQVADAAKKPSRKEPKK